MTYIPGLLMAFETNTRSHDYQTNYPHWHYDHHWTKSTTGTHEHL